MDFKYVRLQGRENAYMTKYPKGIFGMCWRLLLDGKMSEADAEEFKAVDKWFVENLPEPEPCKKQEQVITFFKTTAAEMLKKTEPMTRLLEKYGQPYDAVYTNHVGKIIYEDEWQVAVRVENGRMI